MHLLMGYTHAFLAAADAHATAAKRLAPYGEVDGMMCVIALQNAVMGATKVLGKSDPAVKTALQGVPDLKAVRDMLTHFDEYTVGESPYQTARNGADGPFGWLPMWETGETVHILSRRHGEDMPTSYQVPIHKALRVVATLVLAARTARGGESTPLLDRLTATT